MSSVQIILVLSMLDDIPSFIYHTFGRVQTNLLVEGFYTRLDDVFALRDIEDTADGGKIKERYNGSGATVRGLNAEGLSYTCIVISIQSKSNIYDCII